MGLSHSPKIVTNGLVLALDAANNKSYPRIGTVWSSGWAGSFSNPTYSFDGNLSTSTFQSGTATYTFAGGGLSVSGTVRIYVTFGASSGQVAGLPNVIVVDGTDVSSKMAAANVYTTGVGAGWIDITSEVGSVFNTIVMTGTSNRSNPSIYAVEVDGQILIDAVSLTSWTDLSGNSNNGTLTNGPTFSSANGGSIVFDGTNDYISTPITGTFSQITFDYWGFFDDATLSTTSRNESAFGDWTNDRIHWGTRWSVGMHWNVNGAWTEVGTTNLRYGWNHFSLVWNNNTSQKLIYINKILSLSQATNGNVILGDFRIGVATTLNQYYRGNISNFKVYNRALSASEVLQNYNTTKGRFGL